ncbi:MAG: hypothetical protein KME04_17480 [Pleurocapsa minor GSE-CHR-MK-17-07R]|jgi:DNA polymerase elongation subunit (family B)|nr:hypothetical protein [Pleurocapsa minor GSE-CHR-MK 17-07R]
MLSIIDRVNWDIYKQNAPRLDIRIALVKLNSDEEAECSQGFYDITQGIEFSMGELNALVFDLVPVLFSLMKLPDFRYKELASELLLICGQSVETNATNPELLEHQSKLRKIICEQLYQYLHSDQNDLSSDTKENLAYLIEICNPS